MKILFPISKTFFAKGSFQVRHGDFIFPADILLMCDKEVIEV